MAPKCNSGAVNHFQFFSGWPTNPGKGNNQIVENIWPTKNVCSVCGHTSFKEQYDIKKIAMQGVMLKLYSNKLRSQQIERNS